MLNNSYVLAIITARGGSKRLPRKNIAPLNGQPVIAYTIDAARGSAYIDRTIVSTDDQEIAAVARQCGAEVPFMRPAHLSGDTATSMDVLFHAYDSVRSAGAAGDDIVVLLQPTSPLRTAGDIDAALELMADASRRAVVSVCETEHSPLWCNTLPADNCMKDFIRRELHHVPSQQLPRYYRINGAVYCVRIGYLREQRTFLGPDTYASVMPKNRSVDIDDAVDLAMAQALLTVAASSRPS